MILNYEAAWLVICCFWWALAAVAVLVLALWMIVSFQYYKWDKEAREHDNLVQHVVQTVNEELENIEE